MFSTNGMTKADLRTQFLTERKALSTGEVERRSELIAWHFFKYVENFGLADLPGSVHTFLPIRRQNEVDTWFIINNFWAKFAHINLVVPVTGRQTGQMHHYSISSNTLLVENALGIPEPVTENHSEAPLDSLKAVLVPLLAFDRQGHRVGYGGGFYDRFLADCPPDCQKIGLSLFNPVERISDVIETDIRLDTCITPKQVWQFP